MLIDSHCHLDFPDFGDDLDALIARAETAGVVRMVTISTRVEKVDTLVALAERHDPVFFTVGTHPHQAAEEPEASVETLVRLAAHPKCVGLGEAGLDYHYDKAPRPVAQRVFRTHIAAARASGLPLVIHSRDADEDMAAILTEEMRQGRFSAVLHCFTSSAALARTGLDLGLFISFSGVVTFKNSAALRDIVASVPADRLLVETDAPFLAPVPHRGKRNEPSFVVETAKAVALARQVDVGTIAQTTSDNVLRLFGKMPRFAT